MPKTTAAKPTAKRERAAHAGKTDNGTNGHPSWKLRLYVAGQTPCCAAAIDYLRRICPGYMVTRYEIDVVDYIKNPHLARDHQVLAIPTLVRQLPSPAKKIIGDLSNVERVL